MTQEAERAEAREDNALLAALPTRERNDAHRASQLFTLEFRREDPRGQHTPAARDLSDPGRGVPDPDPELRTAGEVGVVGNEGMVGVDIFMGAPAQLNDAIVQGEGSAW